MTYPNIQTPAARSTDPWTSHDAAEHVTKTGKRTRQQQQVLDLIREHPNCSSEELSEFGVLSYSQIARRTKELVTGGFIESCSVRVNSRGRPVLTWRVKA